LPSSGLEDAPGPVEEDYVLGFEGLAFEVYPEVAGRCPGADGRPEELVVLDAPPLDGDGEVAVRQPGVAVPALAPGLVDT
jgi:hypothetical protein